MNVHSTGSLTPTPRKRSAAALLRADLFRAYCPRAQRTVTWLSYPHYCHWLLHEADPTVAALCEYPDDGRIHEGLLRFSFTLWLRRRDGSQEYWDVPHKRALSANGVKLPQPIYWEAVLRWCQEHGARAFFVTPGEIGKRAVLIRNWARLLPYVQRAQQEGSRVLEDEVIRLLEGAQRPLRLGQFTGYFPRQSSSAIFGAIFHLIHQGGLKADLARAPLGANLQVELAHGAQEA
jgi:hypothetical protein